MGDGTAGLRWQAAESRLCSLVVADPELYELALTLVVEARAVLRGECATPETLAGIDAVAVLDRCPSAAAVRESGLDPAVAVDAARAQRLRELPANGSYG